MKNRKKKGNPPDDMSHEAWELFLYVENDGDLYRQQYSPINKNLVLKKLQGRYDSEKAIKLFMYLVDNGAKKYAKEFASPSSWNKIFSRSDRLRVAREMRDRFEMKYDGGEFNYPEYIPKKYRKDVTLRSNPKGTIESDTPIIPAIIADMVVGEVVQHFRNSDSDYRKEAEKLYAKKNAIANELAKRAERTYKANATFKKLMRSKGDKGRDSLYSFMRHWISGILDKNFRKLYLALPDDFKVGVPLKRRKGNPPQSSGTVIYDRITAIEATKGDKSLWPKEDFRHDFKVGGKIIGLPNGDLLIKKGPGGKKLWKNFDYDKSDGTRKNPAKRGHPKALTPSRYPYEIKKSDVGKYLDSYFGKINKTDVGRLLIKKDGLHYMENMEQMRKRKSKKNKPYGYYVGISKNAADVLPLRETPTKAKFKGKYTSMVGPFKTSREAVSYARNH